MERRWSSTKQSRLRKLRTLLPGVWPVYDVEQTRSTQLAAQNDLSLFTCT
ncbi:hypothetical protein QWZ13_09875 [Reinekea marina]|nr:hypothetical protein [Reinekea marina]MDN3649219.1 hypothetical protein [Reinekea marina]